MTTIPADEAAAIEQAVAAGVTTYEAMGLTRVPAAFGGIPIKKVNELQPYLKVLIYARPGAGKTWLVSQAAKVPAMSPVLYMTTDASEADTLIAAAPDCEIYHLQVNKFDDFWPIVTEAQALRRTPEKLPFKTFILDTVTVTEQTGRTDIMTELLTKGRNSGGEVNVDVPSQREWGQSSGQMRRLIRAIRDLPVNFLATAHEIESRDNAGTIWRKPDVPGKLSNQLAGMFSAVWYLHVKGTEVMDGKHKLIVDEHRILLTGFTVGFVAKTRGGLLDRSIVDPQMSVLYQKITGRDPNTGLTVQTTELGTQNTE